MQDLRRCYAKVDAMSDPGYMAREHPDLIHPADETPPRGVKLILYTRYGTLIMGQWRDDDCLLWMPLPKVSAKLKMRLEKEQA